MTFAELFSPPFQHEKTLLPFYRLLPADLSNNLINHSIFSFTFYCTVYTHKNSIQKSYNADFSVKCCLIFDNWWKTYVCLKEFCGNFGWKLIPVLSQIVFFKRLKCSSYKTTFLVTLRIFCNTNRWLVKHLKPQGR